MASEIMRNENGYADACSRSWSELPSVLSATKKFTVSLQFLFGTISSCNLSSISIRYYLQLQSLFNFCSVLSPVAICLLFMFGTISSCNLSSISVRYHLL